MAFIPNVNLIPPQSYLSSSSFDLLRYHPYGLTSTRSLTLSKSNPDSIISNSSSDTSSTATSTSSLNKIEDERTRLHSSYSFPRTKYCATHKKLCVVPTPESKSLPRNIPTVQQLDIGKTKKEQQMDVGNIRQEIIKLQRDLDVMNKTVNDKANYLQLLLTTRTMGKLNTIVDHDVSDKHSESSSSNSLDHVPMEDVELPVNNQETNISKDNEETRKESKTDTTANQRPEELKFYEIEKTMSDLFYKTTGISKSDQSNREVSRLTNLIISEMEAYMHKV